MIAEKRKGMPRIIDVHAHPYTKIGWRSLGKFWVHLEKYLYGRKDEDLTVEAISSRMPTDDEWVQPFRELGVTTMPVGWDADTAMAPGDPLYRPNYNDEIAAMRDNYPDVVIAGWGSVDPWKGRVALEETERCIKELKLIGLKFQQVGQAFHINDKRFYPLWSLCQDLKCPIQLHTGFTGLGSGAPGGLGTKVQYTMEMIPDIDDVASDFPNLKIIMLHVSDGRDMDGMLLCRHKGNVYREMSGIWPEYIETASPHTWYELQRRQKNKFVFGSEFNLFPLDGILFQHMCLPYREGVFENTMWRNTINILGEEMERVGVNLKEWTDHM
jgi:hypothetical protein